MYRLRLSDNFADFAFVFFGCFPYGMEDAFFFSGNFAVVFFGCQFACGDKGIYAREHESALCIYIAIHLLPPLSLLFCKVFLSSPRPFQAAGEP